MSFEQLLAMVLDPDLLERYGARFIDGLLVTAKLVAISFSLGAVLGLLLALARMSQSRVLQRLSAGYVYFFRGSPLLAQLFLLYYGLGSLKGFWQDMGLWWFFREAWYCTLPAFTIGLIAAVSAGGIAGTLLRFATSNWVAAHWPRHFYLGTLAVNLIDRLVFFAWGEHRIVALALFAPQAKLGAQAVVLARRVEDGRLRRAERRQ